LTVSRTVVIGVGNEFRRDDGLGPAVAAELATYQLPGVSVVVSGGDPVELIAAWRGAELAVVVDAVHREPPTPGRIHRITSDDGLPSASTSTSSHGFDLPAALRLAEALDRRPGRLVIYGTEGLEFGFGPGLSPGVEQALPDLVRAVLGELAVAAGN
jgi:hydrogenase maturation protease